MTSVPRSKWLPAVAVLGVAITWGVSFAVVKATVGEVSPSRLVGWRFALATLTLLTLRPRVLGDLDRQIVGRGIVLGALLGIGFVLCTIGMQTTSVLISAFVTGTTVVFAPLIAWILLRRQLTTRAAAAVFLALVGLAMITMRSFAVGPGTLLILTAAVLWALHLVALERWSRAGHLYGLTVIQLATSATVALGCEVLLDDWQGFTPPMSVPAAAGIIFRAISFYHGCAARHRPRAAHQDGRGDGAGCNLSIHSTAIGGRRECIHRRDWRPDRDRRGRLRRVARRPTPDGQAA